MKVYIITNAYSRASQVVSDNGRTGVKDYKEIIKEVGYYEENHITTQQRKEIHCHKERKIIFAGQKRELILPDESSN